MTCHYLDPYERHEVNLFAVVRSIAAGERHGESARPAMRRWCRAHGRRSTPRNLERSLGQMLLELDRRGFLQVLPEETQ